MGGACLGQFGDRVNLVVDLGGPHVFADRDTQTSFEFGHRDRLSFLGGCEITTFIEDVIGGQQGFGAGSDSLAVRKRPRRRSGFPWV